MQKIIPHLWFDNNVREAVDFYTSLFPNSKVTNVTTLHDTPSGDCDIVSFQLHNRDFMAISAGPLFKFNPSISFMVNFDPSKDVKAKENIEAGWNKLAEGGKILMPIDKYPFSERYGWIQDKYGLSWQLVLTNPDGEEKPPIIPSFLFVGNSYGKAQEAVNYYLSVFKESKAGAMFKYPAGQEPNKEGTVMFSDFRLFDTWFVAMDGGGEHDFVFNEAVSFIVNCEDQDEIDYYWERLSAVPESEQCGWCKDKFGVSWQITPVDMQKMMEAAEPAKLDRITQSFLKMKKIDIAEIKKAAESV